MAMVRFIYNNRPFTVPDNSALDKKLKKLGITREEILIIDALIKEQNIPEWQERNLVKHIWKNINPDSSEYNYTIVGFHKKEDNINNLHINRNIVENTSDWILLTN